MRSHNESMLLNLAWCEQEISRTDLSRLSGLAPSTVSKMVGELLERGLLVESHAARTRGGRPPIVLRFQDDCFQLLGVDLGATHVSVALTDLRGGVLAWEQRTHPVQTDPQGTLQVVLELVDVVVAQAASSPDRIIGLGLGVPSPVDPMDPDSLSPRILPAWEGVHPARHLRDTLGLPVFIDNDANLCALAESWHGVGKSLRSLAYIKLGTGVGAGLMFDGEILHGANGFAGEIGHTAIDSSGPQCTCGLRGCLQAMVGSAAIKDLVRQYSGQTQLSLTQIGTAARTGDPAAVQAITDAGRYLGIAIANLFNLMNPSLVVIGGGLTTAGDILLAPLRQAIHERALWAAIARADVVIGELGERTAALGAATTVLKAALADPQMFTPNRSALISMAKETP